jgi:predicted SnoaL-like aldol condensation-catalyzing enzyme
MRHSVGPSYSHCCITPTPPGYIGQSSGIKDAEDELAAAGMTGEDSLQRNKQNVQAFYDLMFNQARPAQAIAKYAGEAYRQHNPHVGDGKQAFIDYLERMVAEYPGKRVEFKRALARATTSCCTATKSGRVTMSMPASTSSGSTETARWSSTGTCCRSSLRPPPTRTGCSSRVTGLHEDAR